MKDGKGMIFTDRVPHREDAVAEKKGLNYTLPTFTSLMADPEQTLDYLEQQIPSLSAAAVDVAYWQALATGQEVLVSGDGGIYQAYADGTKKLIKTTEKPLSVPVGTRVRLP